MNVAGMRKAALALASMHPADRRWLLARLPVASRAALQPLVLEAQRYTALDNDILQAVLSDETARLAPELPPPDLLIVVLDRLSTPWAARILRGVAQDHAEIYLASCAKSRAEAIRQDMSRLPAAFPRALSDALARYLADAAGAARAEGEAR
ncbi:MAG TPA: hypothetical protein VIM98_08790 [Dyella sp.]|uniref:hypothetical protein n=1 Tax=Dyella sp. TaxID=1869338 RepID=UPI002F946397